MACIRFSALACIRCLEVTISSFFLRGIGWVWEKGRSPVGPLLSHRVGARVWARGKEQPVIFIIVQNLWENQQQIPQMPLELTAVVGALSHTTAHSQLWKQKMLPPLGLKKSKPYSKLYCQNRPKTQGAEHRPCKETCLTTWIAEGIHPCQLILLFQGSKYVCAALGAPKQKKRRKVIKNAYPQLSGLFLPAANSCLSAGIWEGRLG